MGLTATHVQEASRIHAQEMDSVQMASVAMGHVFVKMVSKASSASSALTPTNMDLDATKPVCVFMEHVITGSTATELA